MNMLEIEKKWQKYWEDNKINYFDETKTDKKFYCLEMFSYPSGAKLHVGHWYNYGPTDSYARYKKMKGYAVFQPMGFDAFGLPAENYAIKTGVHPKDSTLKNIETMEGQLKNIGAMFDWSKEIKTCMPDYYKWTQWLFLKLYENGLAYRKEAPVNWCPSCNTVLANEQVVDGACERCGSTVVKKDLTQWFFKITKYADELLEKLDELDWPEKTKFMQKNWIGKSVGAEVTFKVDGSDESFNVFTTRADTLCGVSFVVLAPEHPLVKKLMTKDAQDAVLKYIDDTSKINEIDRLSSTREKTGVFIGAYALNPINGKKVPIYAADYVLYSYGTGAVMGVAAHDERDYEFSKKHGLDIIKVVDNKEKNAQLPYCEEGYLVNSGEFDGLFGQQARTAIVNKLKETGMGDFKVNYRLRDWLVSRQRYWGAPIPVIHCPECGVVPVPYDQLPVELPYDVEFRPDGKSPLAKHDGFMHTKCPKCGHDALRDPDTLDTFVCSSWYYLRYPDAHNEKMPFDPEIINEMLPVDKYVGGPEHACMHLLYARFITKALRDMGYLKFDEPFKSLTHQGIILGPDGNRMSKSRGNVISPDSYVTASGSDVFRLYLMFGFNYTEGGPWNDDGIKSITKFLDRIEKLSDSAFCKEVKQVQYGADEKELDFVLNSTIKAVDKDMESFSFNTAIARMMELVNALKKYEALKKGNTECFRNAVLTLVKLLAPCAPHFCEELFSRSGAEHSIFTEDYPSFDPKALERDEFEYGIQINSKLRLKLTIGGNLDQKQIEQFVLADEKVKEALNGATVKKVIVILKRLVNIIV